MTKKRTVATVALLSGLFLASAGIAADPSQLTSMGQQQQGFRQPGQPTPYSQQLSAPDQLSNIKVQSQQGQEMGSVQKVLLDPQTGQIAYVLIKAQSGEGMQIVPWSSIQVSQQQGQLNLIVQNQQQQFSSPDMLQDARVQTQQGQEIGTVKRTFIDVQEGKVAYVLVQSKNGPDAIVPWNALKVQQNQERQAAQGQQQGDQVTLVFQGQSQQLKEAPQGKLPDILDRRQGELIHQYYGVAPYWEGGESQQGIQPQPQRDQLQPLQQEQQKKRQPKSMMD